MKKKDTDNSLVQDANEIAEYMYGKLSDFEQFPEEKWNSERKIRNAANDLMFYTAQASGSLLPEAAQYDWNNARKNLCALRAVYIFAHKQQYISLDPEVVVAIDGLMAKIDLELDGAKQAIERKTADEMKPWLEKYDLWKQMHDESWQQ